MIDMKKIIFIANLDTGIGMSGGSRIYFELLKNWDIFFYTYLFGSDRNCSRLKKENIKNITFIQTGFNNNPDLQSIRDVMFYSLKRLIEGFRAIKKNKNFFTDKIDYIYSVSDFYPDFFPAFYIKLRNKNIKWIAGYYLFAPNPFSKESPYKGTNRIRGFLYWLMQRPTYLIAKIWADFIFVTSEPDVKKFVTKKRDRSKIIVIQGGVDITESEKYINSGTIIPVSKRKYDTCFVGRFHYQKGVIDLINIWRKVCDIKSDAMLAMIGNGPLEFQVKNKINNLGLKNNITLLGFLDGLEKYKILKNSKIIVHPATYDSGGMAAAEGMAWGLPGVSFDLEALKTYYPKGMVKVKLGDDKKFADEILKLLNDNEYYIKISREAHELIIDVWDWQKRSKIIYDSILNK
jgi:glycosyltransferase involved in cell wall biosynthesis